MPNDNYVNSEFDSITIDPSQIQDSTTVTTIMSASGPIRVAVPQPSADCDIKIGDIFKVTRNYYIVYQEIPTNVPDVFEENVITVTPDDKIAYHFANKYGYKVRCEQIDM